MRSLRLLPVPAALLLAGLAGLSAHCGSDNTSSGTPTDETGPGDGGGGDTVVDETATDASDAATDTKPDAPAPTITCSKSPVFHPPVRVNHNPDSLRRVANAGMVQLDDGRLMVAMLEQIDTSARHGLWARTVDPTTAKASDDERLDVDADELTSASGLSVFAISGGAVGVLYGGSHLKVYSKGKWSPDLAGTLSFSGKSLQYLAAPSGQVLVTSRAPGSPPNGQAVVYRPDEGGVKGSWSAPAALDLDGATGVPRIDSMVLPDGRFMTLIWQGTGGPAIRIRSLSGAWSAPFAKAEIGATDSAPSYRLLDDGSIVLVALEAASSADTRRAVTSTWTATDGWSTARLLSKPTADSNGVIPAGSGPFLYSVSGAEVEFVAWVAGCSSAAADCEFRPVSRRYSGGAWKDPVDLGIGEMGRKGADGASVQAIDGSTPLVARAVTNSTQIDFRVRDNATAFKPTVTLGKDSPYFSDSTTISARFYGGWQGLWTLTTRQTTGSGATTLPTAIGKIDPSADKVTWGLITAGAFELRGFGDSYPLALGSGAFTVGVNNATDGSSTSPIIAYVAPAGGSPEAGPAMSSDEKSAYFANVPRGAPRLNRDRSAIYVVSATLADTTAVGNRLRAYAFNGIGGTVPKILANESRSPRPFSEGAISYGCGGAILYAVDPVDGSHALEVVFVKEEPVGG